METLALAFSVVDFCRAHNLSRGTFYNLLRDGLAPKTFKVGKRTLISREAAEQWRRHMEFLTAESESAK